MGESADLYLQHSSNCTLYMQLTCSQQDSINTNKTKKQFVCISVLSKYKLLLFSLYNENDFTKSV